MDVHPDAPARVAAYLQSSNARGERIGPFLVGFTPHTASPWLNYAVPVHGASPTPADVAALVGEFERRGLLPRLEYLPATAPDVEPALAAAGFTVEGRPPLLVCAPGDLLAAPAADGVRCELATDRGVLHEVLRMQHEAYEEPAPPTEHDVDRIVGYVERGGLIAVARDTLGGDTTGGTAGGGTAGGTAGAVVGAAQTTRAVGGVAELAAVAVAASHRRRGIAAAVSAFVTAAAHDRGADLVWLEAAGPAEQRVYERVGYHRVGEKLYLSRR